MTDNSIHRIKPNNTILKFAKLTAPLLVFSLLLTPVAPAFAGSFNPYAPVVPSPRTNIDNLQILNAQPPINETSAIMFSNEYDYNNRLIKTVIDGKTIEYKYDHTGQRVWMSDGTTTTICPTKYFCETRKNSDNSIISTAKHIFDDKGNVISTITTDSPTSSPSIHYVHTDHLSGSNVITNSNGEIEQTLDYYPYGSIRLNEKTGTFDEKRKFAGSEFDSETGLNYMNARYYNPVIGRFLSQDPAFLAVGDNQRLRDITKLELQQYLANPQNLNSYSYARNNPIINTDRTGYFPETPFDILSLGLSIRDFNENRSFLNGFFVALDGAGLAIPFIPSAVGYVRHGTQVARILKYFDKVSSISGKSAVSIGELFTKNIGFKFSRRAWSAGEAGDSLGSLVGHYAKWGESLGAENVGQYYNKANDFIGNKQYTHAFREGEDMVYFNRSNKQVVVTGSKGEIKSYHPEQNINKLQNYEARIKKGNYE